MALREIFAKLMNPRGGAAATEPVPYDDPANYIRQPQEKEVSEVMKAIRASRLEIATVLMQGGAEVDFSDPAIETQMRVATYETNFEFLKALDDRRKIQDAAEKEAERAAQVTRAQVAEGEKLQTLAGITTAVSGGTENSMTAPKTASFSKKPGRTA
jgi:hypothetical protein